jgi:hypothetical protein
MKLVRYFSTSNLNKAGRGAMIWQICIRYPNGQEKALCFYRNREIALKRIDAIYSQGYPMHVAYVVRPAEEPAPMQEQTLGRNCLQVA